MRAKPKQNCVDCHFFMKRGIRVIIPSPGLNLFEIEAKYREFVCHRGYEWLDQANYALVCSFGVWVGDHNFIKTNAHQVIVETNRRDFCFWWKHHPDMHLSAATILQEREAKNRDSARDRRLTLYGLWIAAIALIINSGVTLAPKLKQWLFN